MITTTEDENVNSVEIFFDNFSFYAFVDIVHFLHLVPKEQFEGTKVITKTEDENVNSVEKFFDNFSYYAFVDVVHSCI